MENYSLKDASGSVFGWKGVDYTKPAHTESNWLQPVWLGLQYGVYVGLNWMAIEFNHTTGYNQIMAAYPRDRFHFSVFLLLVGLMSLSGVSPVRLQAWQFDPGGFSRQPMPPQAAAFIPLYSGDLKGDGVQEVISLQNGRAELWTRGGLAWQSPESWEVKQAILADLNRDGRLEAVLLVWRDFRPWPIDQFMPNGGRIADFHDSKGKSCHLILIGWKKNGFGELWAGSALAEPLLKIAAVDLTGNGQQELVTLESDYGDPPGSPARALTAWEWNGFGFSLLGRIRGRFWQMQAVVIPSRQPMIVVQQ